MTLIEQLAICWLLIAFILLMVAYRKVEIDAHLNRPKSYDDYRKEMLMKEIDRLHAERQKEGLCDTTS